MAFRPLADVDGPLAPAAVLRLGQRLVCVQHSLACVVVNDDGNVFVDVDADPTLPERLVAPELRRGGGAVSFVAAHLWSVGRILLEVALGRAVDDEDLPLLRGLADVDGRVLPTRLCDVLCAVLPLAPDERLQTVRAALRVFSDAESSFGDGDAALRAGLCAPSPSRATRWHRAAARAAAVPETRVRAEEDAPPTWADAPSTVLIGPVDALAKVSSAPAGEKKLPTTADLPLSAILDVDALRKLR